MSAPEFLLIKKNGNGSNTLFKGNDLEEVRDFCNLKVGDVAAEVEEPPEVAAGGSRRRRRPWIDGNPYTWTEEG